MKTSNPNETNPIVKAWIKGNERLRLGRTGSVIDPRVASCWVCLSRARAVSPTRIFTMAAAQVVRNSPRHSMRINPDKSDPSAAPRVFTP